MKQVLTIILFLVLAPIVKSQSLAQIKKELDTTKDPIGYVKYKLKKRFKIDTVTVISTTSFLGIADSLAYKGKIGKVYGPFQGGKYLLKVLAKVPNTFYHVRHILIDTAIFSRKFADSLANNMIQKIKTDSSTFQSMARTYSNDNVSANKGGDLGWFIRGAMLPQLDAAIAAHKKGEIFKVWTAAGLHVVTINDTPKKDNGFALLLRVFL